MSLYPNIEEPERYEPPEMEEPMNGIVTCISISLGNVSQCIRLDMGQADLYLHGSTDDVRQFGADIIAAADREDIRLREKQEAANVHA